MINTVDHLNVTEKKITHTHAHLFVSIWYLLSRHDINTFYKIIIETQFSVTFGRHDMPFICCHLTRSHVLTSTSSQVK